MDINTNPFNVKFTNITITKFNGSDKLSITPQVLELTLYQSLFSPFVRADMVINDLIGLMVNYPLTGEEIVEVQLEQNLDFQSKDKYVPKTLKFVITAIRDINFRDTARHTIYSIELASFEAFRNAKTRVSHAYNDTIEEMIKQVYEQYLKNTFPKETKTIKFYNATKKTRTLVIPNLKPVDAINWLCKFAVSDEPNKYYTFAFFETLDGFVFKSLQKPTFLDAEDDQAYINSSKEKYFYISNQELLLNNNEMYQRFVADGFNEVRTINDLKINKRYTTLEKIVGGYFENEFVEINMLQKDHLITKTKLDKEFNQTKSMPDKQLGSGNQFNTENYNLNIQNEYTNDETSSRIRYIINNYEDMNQPSFRDKFGNSSRSFLAFNQVDLSIAIHSNLKIRIGDLMYLRIPEMHGFNNAENFDQFLSGHFIVSEVKTVIKTGNFSQSYIRLNKDSFGSSVDVKSKYNLTSSTDWDTQRR